MVNQINIGIIGIQGAIIEHQKILEKIYKTKKIQGNITVVKKTSDLENLNGLIIPGGESTTISRFLEKTGLKKAIKKKIAEENLNVMGTCAGCVILSKKLTDCKKKDVKLINVVDIEVERNAFGRQKESFETTLKIKDLQQPFNAVFIRAPVIRNTGDDVEVLAETDNKIVMIKQKNILALSFHPELTDDTRIHEYFIDMIKK
jgi:pyridoxal 5'-phosphate synthase pdxT subunit